MGRTRGEGATIKFIDVAFAMETDDCIPWPFSLDKKGYPQAQDAVGFYKPHRRICERRHGPPPTPKHHAAHKCEHRPCINKRHLRWATPKENEADKSSRGIRRVRRLTDEQALTAIARIAAGEQYKVVGADCGVTDRAIKKIVAGETYRDLHRDPQVQRT